MLDSVREKKAYYLLTSSGFRKSRFSSLVDLVAYLCQQSFLVKAVEEVATISNRRKVVCEMGSEMLGTYEKQINEYVASIPHGYMTQILLLST